MRKYIKYILILFIISIGIGLAISYVKRNGKVDISAQNISGNTEEVGTENEAVEPTSTSSIKITPDTKFIVESKFEDCKHTETNEYEAPDEVINMTEEEFEENYPEYIVVSFSEEEISLFSLEEGLCSSHYIISVDDDKNIIIYNLTSDYDKEIYETTEIGAEYLSADDQKELEEGIYVYGLSELNSTLENFE